MTQPVLDDVVVGESTSHNGAYEATCISAMSDVSDTDALGIGGFDAATLAQLREVFDFLDQDHSGAVCMDEIGYLMELLKLDCSEDALKEILSEVDSDNDGHVSFEEFVKVIGGAHTIAYSNADAQRAFRMFAEADAPRGCISKTVLRRAIVQHCSKQDVEDIDLERLISQFSNTLEDWVDYKCRIDLHIPK